MLWLTDSIEAIRDFMELGGPVLRCHRAADVLPRLDEDHVQRHS
jgi:hypothetical protein